MSSVNTGRATCKISKSTKKLDGNFGRIFRADTDISDEKEAGVV